MQKKDYIQVFLSHPNGRGLRNSLEEIAKEMQNRNNVFTLFPEPADYCLYQLLSENDSSLRIPNVIRENDNSENINIILIAVNDWKFAFNVWKNVQAEYECFVQLTVAMSYCTKFDIPEILKNEEKSEVLEFLKTLKIQGLAVYGKEGLEANISWINTQKRVLVALCHERYRNRINSNFIKLSREQMIHLQTSAIFNWKYLGIGNLIPDLIFGREPYNRETQHGVFSYTNSVIREVFGDLIKLFIKYSWNDRNEFVCDFTPVVQIGSLTTSNINSIFKTLFTKLSKKGMSTIKKYRFIEHYFECYVAVAFSYYASFDVKIVWNVPDGMEEFYELLKKDEIFFVNDLKRIKVKIKKAIDNYFTDSDLLSNVSFFKLPTGKISYLYFHFDLIMIMKKRRGEDCFVSFEMWMQFVLDYFITESQEDAVLYSVLLLEITMFQRGIMLETYFVKDDRVCHGFMPGENLEVLHP